MGKLIKDKVVCRICQSSIAYSGNTSNLTYHLQKQHLLAFKEVEKERKPLKDDEKQAKQLANEDAISNTVPYTKESTKYKKIVNATSQFISEAMMPVLNKVL